MPLDYSALNQRLTDALASGNPVDELRNIAEDIKIPRGDIFDHNIAMLALGELDKNPPNVQGAARWLRNRFNPRPPVLPAPALPPAPAAGEPSTGGRRRRRPTRRHRKTRKHSRKHK